MAEGLPEIYRKSSEVQASYQYTDIISGLGYIDLYGFGTSSNAGIGLKLSNKAIRCSFSAIDVSNAGSIGSSSGSGTVIDADFDTSIFNIPTDLKGDAISHFSFTMYDAGAVNGSQTCYFTVKYRKVAVGGAESEIANTVSPTYVMLAGNEADQEVSMITTIPITHFKIGEKLRITVEAYLSTGGQSTAVMIGHDPYNSALTMTSGGVTCTLSAGHTIMTFAVPVRIDI